MKTALLRILVAATTLLLSLGSHAQTATASGTGTPAMSSAASLAQVLIGLAVVLALMFGVAWLMKRFGMARASGNQTVKLIGGVNVGNRERVLVVEVNNQWIVVGVAPGRVNALATLPKGSSVADAGVSSSNSESTPAKSFASWLQAKTSPNQAS